MTTENVFQLSLHDDYASQILSTYLWGNPAAPNPADLVDSQYTESREGATVEFSAQEYMNQVGTDFVKAHPFGVFKRFFAAEHENGSNVKFDTTGLQANANGEYELTHTDVVNELYEVGEKNYNSIIDNPQMDLQHYYWKIDAPGYAERAFTFGSSKLTFDTENVRYIVDKDGNPLRIENLEISPMDTYEVRDDETGIRLEGENGIGTENFDFDSTDGLAKYANQILNPMMDPSGIGERVTIKFTGQVAAVTLNKEQFEADLNAQANKEEVDKYYQLSEELTDIFVSESAEATVEAAREMIQNQFWHTLENIRNSHVFDYLTPEGKLVIYGTGEDDNNMGIVTPNGNDLSEELISTPYYVTGAFIYDFLQKNHMHDYLEKGVTYVSGRGNDQLKGTDYNDDLFGGEDFDNYYINGKDTIFDSDGKGSVYFGNDKVGYLEQKDDTTWESLDGSITAEKRGNDLLVFKGDDQVTITDYFSQAANSPSGSILGISLQDASGLIPLAPENNNKMYVEAHGRDNAFKIATENGSSYVNLSDAGGSVVTTGEGRHYVVGSLEGDLIKGNTWNDYLVGSTAAGYTNADALNSDNDAIIGGEGNDIIIGRVGNDSLFGDDVAGHTAASPQGANNTERGDWIAGGQGNDDIYGSYNADMLMGGSDNDTIKGGDGNDVILGDDSKLISTYSSSYTDRITHYIYNTTDEKWDTETFRDAYKHNRPNINIFKWDMTINHDDGTYDVTPGKGQFYDESPTGQNNTFADTLYGDGGDDLIIGQQGADKLYGGEGNDVLWGGNNLNDTDNSHDTLIGGAGSDMLRGGAGMDSYIFSKEDFNGSSSDTIIDDGKSAAGVDQIMLSENDDYSNAVYLFGMDWRPVNGQTNTWEAGEYRLQLSGTTLVLSNTAAGYGGTVEIRDFANGDYGLDLLGSDNQAPEVGNPVSDLSATESVSFSHTFGDDLFTDPDGDALTYSISNLPAGLQFDASTRTVSGTPTEPGSYLLTLTATDPDGESATQTLSLTVAADGNQAPEIVNPVSDLSATESEAFSHTFSDDLFTDPDGDALTYSISNLPAGLQFDASSRTVSGTPTEPGSYSLTLTATDPEGASVTQTLSFTVESSNQAPEVGNPVSDLSAIESEAFSHTFSDDLFTDPDGDALTYSISDLPAGLQFDANTRTVSGTPTEPGSYSLILTATDPEGASVTQTLSLTVESSNQAPEVGNPVSDLSATESEAFSHTFSDDLFTDPDGDALTYSISDLPARLQFDASTRTVSGTPTTPGNYSLTLTATDPEGASVTQTLSLTVESSNQAPEVGNPVSDLSATESEAFSHTFSDDLFTDPDGDALTYSISNLPAGLQFDANTRTVSGTPTTPGSYSLTLTATDPEGASVTQTLSFTVESGNHAPELQTEFADLTATEGEVFSIQLPLDNFIDADGDTLVYTVNQSDGQALPDWLVFDAQTGTLSGTPTDDTDLNLTITATDDSGDSASDSFILDVKEPTLDISAPWFGGTVDGGSGDDTLSGSWFGDTLNGNAGDDTLNGGFGRDVINGGEGDDALNGGWGRDTLTGGTGNDVLQGGIGSDTYVFNAGDGQDVIEDRFGFEDSLIINDIALSDLLLDDDSDNWIIGVQGSEDQITINDADSWWGGRIETIQVGDTEYSYEDFAANVAYADLDNSSTLI